MWKAEVQIPRAAEYEVTLKVSMTGNRSRTSSRRYRLRDFLVVAIGDSFAAGQGNPDIPAIPSLDQKALCKSTSFLLVITKASDMFNNFRRKLEQETKEAIEDYLPFIGKIIVAELNFRENVVAFVKDGIKSLGNVAGGFLSSAGEVGEELFEKIGFGDGGEFDEIMPQSAQWQESNAYRSYRSGHSLAARKVETDNEFGADRVTFLSFARSGSEIQDGLLGPRTVDPNLKGTDVLSSLSIDHWIGNRGQVQEAKDTMLGRRIDALIVTISVNDMRFTSLVSDSILQSDDAKRRELIRTTEIKIAKQLPLSCELLKKAIDSQLRPRHVFITEYPTGVFTEFKANHQVDDGRPCGVLSSTNVPTTSTGLDLDIADGEALRELGKLLNGVLRDKASKFGWTFIDGIEHSFDGHGYCASQPYFVSAEDSCLNQGDFEGMLHPNKKGHEVTRDYIAQALKRELLATHEGWLEPVLMVTMS
jgi:lysophospholipase L1-like esterase